MFNKQISARLYLGFAVVLLMLIAIAAETWMTLSRTSGLANNARQRVESVNLSTTFSRAVETLENSILQYALTRDAADRGKVNHAQNQLLAAHTGLVAAFTEDRFTDSLGQITTAHTSLIDMMPQILKRLDVDSEVPEVLFGSAASLATTIGNLQHTLLQTGHDDAQQVSDDLSLARGPFVFSALRYLSSRTDADLQAFRKQADAMTLLASNAKPVLKGQPRNARRTLQYVYRDIDTIKNAVTQLHGSIVGYQTVMEKFATLSSQLALYADRILTAEQALQQDELTAFGKDADMAVIVALSLGGTAILVAIVVAGLLARTISRPLQAITQSMNRLKDGDLTSPVYETGRKDEIGALAQGLGSFRQALQANEASRAAEVQDRDLQELRRKATKQMFLGFNMTVSGVLESLDQSTGVMVNEAQGMRQRTESTTGHADSASQIADSTAENVRSVSVAAQQLSDSLKDVASHVTTSSDVAGTAVRQAGETNHLVSDLNQSATAINEVVEIINEIATKTNMLALNAAIEARRAGIAGKGFAVVAAEVKSLAGQTAEATSQIAEHVDNMQGATRQAIASISEIETTIQNINAISTTIASAVDQQSMATGEISRNVEEAAHRTTSVSQDIGEVRRAAGETGETASHFQDVAADFAGRVGELSGHVRAFLAASRIEHQDVPVAAE